MSTHTGKPEYADFDTPAKFKAIEGIIARRLIEHPKAICSYSGGSDSDIMIDLIERVRGLFPQIQPVKYVFFNTGLEMKATKDHVKETAKKYGVEIEECRPKVNIVQATRKCGVPFVSKGVSERLGEWQKKDVPLSIAKEYEDAENKAEKRKELDARYPKCSGLIGFLCGCDSSGNQRSDSDQLSIKSVKYLLDFINEYPPDFNISAQCCNYCKKQLAHRVEKEYEMIITGERKAEGGVRTFHRYSTTGCFTEKSNGQYRLRPLYYVSNADKAWYKEHYGIRYSDAYEVYGLTRTGCCGCSINYKAATDLERIRPYEPNVVKAAWNIFGKSYEYRAKYNEYKAKRQAEEKERSECAGQCRMDL